MFKTSTTDHDCDNGGDSLHAGLLITATSSGKYGRLWRRSLCVGVFISLSKRSSDHHGISRLYFSLSSSSLPSYVPVPPLPAEEQFSRTLSSRSQLAIDVRSDSEKEEENLGDNEEDEQELLGKSGVRIVEEKDLDSLRRFDGVELVASVRGSNLETGIDGGHEPEVWNTTNPVHAKGFLHFFLEACNSYTIFLLLISAGLSFGIEIIDEGPKYGWHDGATILFAVFLLVTFPSVANFRRARKLEKELSKKTKLEVYVQRGGTSQLVTISDIKVGDKLCLNKGDRIPADGSLVHDEGLVLDEVSDSNIDPDQNRFLFSGSKVIDGHGHMLVTSVGTKTKLGKVLILVSHDPRKKTVLEAKIEKPNAYIDNVALCISVLISLVLLLRLLGGKHDDENGSPELKGKISVGVLMKISERIFLRPRGIIGILTTSLTAVVIGLQHGMPFVITVSLSYWKEKMVFNQANPQNLSACGTMGLVDVVCVDTTGGLMCNPTEVRQFWIGEKDVKDDENFETSQLVLEALSHGIGASDLVSEIPVSPIDDSLLSWANSRWGMDMAFPEQSLAVLDFRKLCSNKKCSGVLMKKNGDDEKILHLHWKGAASTILGMCSHYYDCGGETCALENQKSKFEQAIKDMEDGGLRPIAYAYKQTEIQELREDGLNLLAIVGFKYTCQEETKSAVEALRNAGVSIKLVSEDELSAVRALACGLGVFRPGSNDVVLEGEEFRKLNDTARREMVDKITVMASSLPEDKLHMVQCLKQNGHIVAFWGGSTTSDTPALKEADVGISEETRSTEMARESSDIVISDNGRFNSITPNLRFGRCVYHNIQKFIQLQLTAIISGLLTNFIATMFLGEAPLTVIQLIWVNLIVCLLGGLMLVMEPPSQDIMINQPAKRGESLITKIMTRNIAIQVLYQAIVLMILQFIPGMNQKVRKGLIFNIFTLCQVFNQSNAMNLEKKEVFVVVLQNYCFPVTVGAIAVMQFLVVEFVGSLANCMRLNWVQWAFCFIIAALSWVFDRAVKFISNSLTTWFCRSVGSSRMPSSYASLLVFPFSFFLLIFSLSYYFNPDIAVTFR